MAGSEKALASAPVNVASPCRSCVRNAAPLSPGRRRRAHACGAPIHARTEVESVDGELIELRSRGVVRATIRR